MIEFDCPNCGAPCAVPRSMAGGRTNCARCGMLVEIPGADYVFIAIVAAAALLVLGVAGLAFAAGGPWAGGAALLVGFAILGAIVAAS